MQITYTSGPAERAVAARYALAPIMPRVLRIAQASAVGALILSLLFTRLSAGSFRIADLLLSLCMALAMFANVRFLYPISTIDRCRRQRPKFAQITAQFDDRGITILTDGTRSTLAWSLVQNAAIQPPYLLILLERNAAMAFPLSAFPDDSAAECLALIRSHRTTAV
ncbi:YcxB family protein [Chloroflexia bacterium SDU3-3]|nr:YcxB family protein [Chloroflexia bacterium SDU3-3]